VSPAAVFVAAAAADVVVRSFDSLSPHYDILVTVAVAVAAAEEEEEEEVAAEREDQVEELEVIEMPVEDLVDYYNNDEPHGTIRYCNVPPIGSDF